MSRCLQLEEMIQEEEEKEKEKYKETQSKCCKILISELMYKVCGCSLYFYLNFSVGLNF